MLIVTKVYYEYWYEDNEYEQHLETDSETLNLTFRELVDILKEHLAPSCSPASGTTCEWYETYPYQNPYTGKYTHTSIHYARANPKHKEKYWKKAAIAANLVKG